MQVWTNRDRHGEANSYDYDIIVNDDIELRYSSTTEWATPNALAATLSDDGNGVKIVLGGKKIKLDYHEIVELMSLLIFHHEDKIELRETKTIKAI
jgi:hypothetical protein